MHKSHIFQVSLSIAILLMCSNSLEAQESCPNSMTFGVHTSRGIDKSLQSAIEIAYFTTDDPNAFIVESKRISQSSSFAHFDTVEFLATLELLERKGVARVQNKAESVLSLGETARLTLDRPLNDQPAELRQARFPKDEHAETVRTETVRTERKSEVSIEPGTTSGGYYRIDFLSWFFGDTNSTAIVDYDGSVLMKPGETTIFKMRSDFELSRSGSKRNYVAITLHSVNPVK